MKLSESQMSDHFPESLNTNTALVRLADIISVTVAPAPEHAEVVLTVCYFVEAQLVIGCALNYISFPQLFLSGTTPVATHLPSQIMDCGSTSELRGLHPHGLLCL